MMPRLCDAYSVGRDFRFSRRALPDATKCVRFADFKEPSKSLFLMARLRVLQPVSFVLHPVRDLRSRLKSG
jgi:hypothetical protein